jgi:hypothetical protein
LSELRKGELEKKEEARIEANDVENSKNILKDL